MDSGDYRETAQLVVGAWEERCAALAAEGRPPLPPITLLHSNIDALDDIVAAAALPKRLRPRMLGFGGLTDGFQPFELPQEGAAGARTGGNSSGADTNAGTGACAGLSAGPSIGAGAGVEEAGTAQLAMASLVMKLVQARPPAAVAAAATVQACAVKLGDGSGGKMQVMMCPAHMLHVAHAVLSSTFCLRCILEGAGHYTAGQILKMSHASGMDAASLAWAGHETDVIDVCSGAWHSHSRVQLDLGLQLLTAGLIAASCVPRPHPLPPAMQVDPRLEAAAAAQLRQQMGAMAARTAALRGAEGEAVLRVQRALSNSLREAYVSVTRQGLLQQG